MESDAPVQVTLRDLQRLGASAAARAVFAEMFPDGASYRQMVIALADHPDGLALWAWLSATVPALTTAREAFEAQTRQIREAYNVRALQIVEAYKAQILPIEEAYCTQLRTIANVFDPQMLPISAAHDAQLRLIRDACDAQLYSIWEAFDAQLRSAMRNVAEMV